MAEADVRHAIRRVMRTFTELGDHEIDMNIGPGSDGSILEVGVVNDDDPRINHAARARQKYLDTL